MKTLSEMVREAGLPEAWISRNGVLSWEQLKRFSKLVRADEREACAVLVEGLDHCSQYFPHVPDIIRARSKT